MMNACVFEKGRLEKTIFYTRKITNQYFKNSESGQNCKNKDMLPLVKMSSVSPFAEPQGAVLLG